MKTVIITGAMGFIGSHTAKLFKKYGYHVIGIDRALTIPSAAQYLDQLILDDYTSTTADAVVNNDISGIVHCAGTSLVGPSIKNPYEYYTNNSSGTNILLNELHVRGWHGHIVFSSSAATYGLPVHNRPLVESDTQLPINPYGWSKLFCEQIINDHCAAHGFSAVILRYFNAAGADSDSVIGHVPNDTHLIPRILSAYQAKQKFELYGIDYSTSDGSCIRDYLHVEDIAQAHYEAVLLKNKIEKGHTQAFNLGTGVGYSNLEILKKARDIVGKNIELQVCDRRHGDPDILVASSDKFQKTTGWKPKHNLESIIQTAWTWQQKY